MRRLCQPFRIGQMDLRNRVVLPPMVTLYGSDMGYVTERTRSYYEARARGGAALIIVEGTYVHKGGHTRPNQLAICSDSYVAGMSKLVEVIHKHGAKAALQLDHGGRMAKSKLSGMQPVAPSPLAIPGGEIPRELSTNDIELLVGFFSAAALRAKKAGFDGIEIQAAHGYLIDQFLSPYSNKRRDVYGGDVRNRARFLIEVIRATKEVLGKDYPVWCRIDGREYGVQPGITLCDAQETAQMAQQAGCDAIHVSAAGPEAPTVRTTPIFSSAVIEELCEGIKQSVTVPVIAVGRITPDAGEKMLEEEKTDLIAIGKGMLADPELPNKALSDRLDDINPCIVCMRCLNDVLNDQVEGIRCSVNASLGREAEYTIRRAKNRKKVLVAGGGPAGMETARIAALRGHSVILCEKETKLGGQLNLADVAPYKDRVGILNQYLQTQLSKLGVELRLGEEVTLSSVELIKPDAVVVATGVADFTPDIPGLHTSRAVHAGDVLAGKAQVGPKVVVIGGEVVGCETAEFLADRGKKVVVTRRGTEMAMGIGPVLREFLLDRLKAKGVTLLTGVTYVEVSSSEVTLTTREGQTRVIEADTIVLAAGAEPNRTLYDQLKGRVAETYLVGDCIEPRSIRDAITDGFRIGHII